VGIESTLAGWASTLFSLTRAADTYCGIMKPELRPPSTVRNAGSPSDSVGFTIRSVRRSEIEASSDTAIASASSANATGSPWKFPFETSISSSTSTSGLSVAAFSSVETT
jgi:hypothetical protein